MKISNGIVERKRWQHDFQNYNYPGVHAIVYFTIGRKLLVKAIKSIRKID